MGESGWNPKDRGRAPHSVSHSRESRGDPDAGARPIRILIAEDNGADVLLVREALNHHHLDAELSVQPDGERMLRFVDQIEAGDVARPDIVLLDLNLPRRSGQEILAYMRATRMCADVPVIIVTSSDAPADREATTRLGATGYFRKPSDYDLFLRLGGLIRDVLDRSKHSD